jgi:superfamily II DNA or RNA helicase
VTVEKILPNRGTDERGFVTNVQETAILRQCWEFSDENPNASHSFLNASTPDSGKTVMTVELILRMGFKRCLILGVRETADQWSERMDAQSDGTMQIRQLNSTKAGKAEWDKMASGADGIWFAGAEWITAQDWEPRQEMDTNGHKLWKEDEEGKRILRNGEPVPVTKQHHRNIFKRVGFQVHPFDLIAFDEVQKVSNRKSVGRKSLVTIPAVNKLALSGTPVGNKFSNSWSITRWLWPEHIDASFQRWSDEWCESKPVLLKSGKVLEDARGNPVRTLGNEREEGEFVKTLPGYLRMESEREVPEPEIVEVDLSPAQRADYDDLLRDMMLYLESPEGQRVTLVADIPIVLRTHLRSATLAVMSMHEEEGIFYADDAISSKLHALRGIVDREDWRGRPVVIYTHSRRFARIIALRMNAAGYGTAEWSGKSTRAARKTIKADFMAGRLQYIVATIQALGTGLDGFQTKCNRVVWLSETEDFSANLQASRRVFRSGNDAMLDDFQAVKVIARDTYDSGILSRNVANILAMRATLRLVA